ncbi:cyclin-dependent serine serine/threonine-protein kinase DDB_G0292550 [Octopus vulgaris]|uniref:Cyclin-dependent serine serine/threonine-protein kinase DDB_G0292550 n=1 Tax=Octopus vulgaris TaxID=6645 RepID=A0AA36C1K4_OCTVU|nr:cyclin-dependent serine serine/threonine-protein kinase DDB_G0292550 [Octopus vulgaris]
MTNIYADKMRFGNKRNKCDVVGFVNGNHVNKDIEDSSNINSTSSEIDYEGRIGMTNSRDNHNNDVGDDISDYNDYQGGNNSVNCTDNVHHNTRNISTYHQYDRQLANNIITTIPQGAFQNLQSLKKIYLYNNKITTIQQGSFQNCPSLHTL